MPLVPGHRLGTRGAGGNGRTWCFGILAALLATVAVGSARAQNWNVDASGAWQTAGNWSTGTVPNGIGASATLGNVITAPRTVTLGSAVTLGELQFDSPQSYTVSGAPITFDVASGQARLVNFTTGSQAVTSDIVLNDQVLVSPTQARVVLSGNISGDGGLTMGASNVLVLTGRSTYRGSTVVSNGTLQIGDGGTTGSIEGNISGGAKVVFNRLDDLAYGGRITGLVSLTKLGAGTLTLSGVNSYSRGTFVDAGTLKGTTTSLRGFISNDAAVVFDQDTDGTYSGTMTGSGSLAKAGSGTLTLTAANTYGGGTTVSGGTLKGTTTSLQGNIVNNATVVFDQAIDGTYGGNLSGTGRLTKQGAGTATLRGANTYSGATTLAVGTLRAGAANTFAARSAHTVAGGATLDLAGLDQAVGSLAGAGSVTLGSATLTAGGDDSSTTFSGVISGSGRLSKAGGGTMTLSGANTYGGGTTVSGGTLVGTTTSLQGDIVNDAAVVFDQASDGTYGGNMSGTGSLTKSGDGTLTFSGANTYAGATTVAAVTLKAGAVSTFAARSAHTVAAGATLDLAGFDQVVGSLAGAGNVTLGNATLTAGGDDTSTTFSGTFSGSGGLIKAGTGTMTLSGANRHSGATAVTGGTLRAGAAHTFSAASAHTVAAGTTLDLAGFDQAVGSLAGAGSVTLGSGVLTTGGDDTSTTFSGTISGAGGLAKRGTGTMTLSGANTYAATTTVDAGTLAAGAAGTFAAGSAHTISAGATLDLAGFAQSVGSLAGAGSVTLGSAVLTTGSDGTGTTFSGTISGSGGLAKTGAGTLILSGANSYGGATTIAAGTLRVGNGGTSGSLGNGAVINDAVLIIDRADALTIANAISGTGRLVQAGSGTTILTAASSFTGGTTVSAGTLVLNGSLASGVVVASGATLGGSGSIVGTLTVNGAIAPGNSIGTLSVTGTYVQNAGSTYRVEINPAGQSDRIAVTGAATLNGGTVQVVAAPGRYRHGTTTYTILTATAGVTGTFDGLVTDYAFRRIGLAYDPTAVYLQVLAGTFVDGAQTINQNAVAQSLDAAWGSASGDFATVLGALMELNGSAGRAALETIGGQPWAGLPSTNLAGATLFMDAVGRQVAAARQATQRATPGSRVALAEACSGACDETAATSGWSAWAMALGGTGSVAGDGNAAALSWTLGGFAAGIDHGFAPGVLAGVALGMTGGSQSVATFTGPSSVTAVQASLYASLSTGGSYVDAMAGYGTSDNQLTRVLAIPGLATRQARGRTGAHQLFAQVEAGHRFEIDRGTRAGLAPYLRFQAASVAMNGFSEWGADSLDLSAAPWTTTSVRSILGVQADAALAVGLDRPLGVQFRLGWSHEYADTARPFAATLAGAPGNGFTVYGAQALRDAVTLGLGVEARLAASVAAFLRYDGLVATGADAHALGIGLRVAF